MRIQNDSNMFYALNPQCAPGGSYEPVGPLRPFKLLYPLTLTQKIDLQIVLGLFSGLDLALICLDQSASSRVLFASNESQVPKEHTLGIGLHLWEQRYPSPNAGIWKSCKNSVTLTSTPLCSVLFLFWKTSRACLSTFSPTLSRLPALGVEYLCSHRCNTIPKVCSFGT